MSINQRIAIENNQLRVEYDAEINSFSVIEKDSNRAFIRKIRTSDIAVNVSIIKLSNEIWGNGQSLEIERFSGIIDHIMLYDGLPFALLRRTLTNSSRQPLVYRSVCPVSLTLDMDSENLRALGTEGLTGVSSEENPGSYAFLSVADPDTRSGVVTGWLTHDRGSGVLFSDIANDAPVIRAQIDYGNLLIKPGNSSTLETLAIGWFGDIRLGLEAYADAIAEYYDIKLRPQPTVYCTWYHAGASDENRLIENAAFAKKHLAPFGFSVVQIDDGWQAGESDNGPRKNFTTHRSDGPYKSGMKNTADKLKFMDVVPGIWFMPFAGTWNASHFADKQHWFAQMDGKPFDTSWGGTCLDVTHSEAREYLRSFVHRIAHDWGYRYFKMDGLWTGTASRQMYINTGYKDDKLGESKLHNPEITHIEAYRSGLRMIREAAGDDVFFLGCCVSQNMRSLGGSFGLVDAIRVGPDNGRSWDGIRRGPFSGSNLYFLHGRVWHNDPDPVYVREDVPIEQARLLVSWVTITGQLNASSIDFGELPEERLDILKRSMPCHNLMPRPVDMLEQRIPRIWLLTDDSEGMRRDIMALFNWENEGDINIEYPMEKIGLSADETYIGFDYWADEFVQPFSGTLKANLPHGSCKILSVRPVREIPQLLSTSRHITQGIIDVCEEHWDDETRTLSGISNIVGNDPYKLSITALSLDKNWKMKSFGVSDVDKDAGVAISATQNDAEICMLIKSKKSCKVGWHIKFTD